MSGDFARRPNPASAEWTKNGLKSGCKSDQAAGTAGLLKPKAKNTASAMKSRLTA